MSLAHKTGAYQTSREGRDCRDSPSASNGADQLLVLPFICPGLAIVEEFDCEQFWKGYRLMSGIIFVLLAIEILVFGVLQL